MNIDIQGGFFAFVLCVRSAIGRLAGEGLFMHAQCVVLTYAYFVILTWGNDPFCQTYIYCHVPLLLPQITEEAGEIPRTWAELTIND